MSNVFVKVPEIKLEIIEIFNQKTENRENVIDIIEYETDYSRAGSQNNLLFDAKSTKKFGTSNYKFPKFILIITILQILIHLLNEYFEEYSLYEDLKFNAKNKWKLWTYLTYMLVHSKTNHWHLIMNMAVQLLYGVSLEPFNRGWKVLLIYLGSGVCGAVIHVICRPHENLCGASAGICGLMIASLFFNGMVSEILNQNSNRKLNRFFYISRIQKIIAFIFYCWLSKQF